MASWKPAKPSTYHGERDAFVLEAWISSMTDYIQLAGVPEEHQVRLAGTYLKDHAAVWFLTFKNQWVDKQLPTWHDFELALRTAFMPPNHIQSVMDKWAGIKQTSSVHNYVEAFQALLMQLPHNATTPIATLDRFIRGLKPKTELEVRLRDPATLDEAIRIADRFDTIYRPTVAPNSRAQHHWTTTAPHAPPSTSTPMEIDALPALSPMPKKLTPEERERLVQQGGCFSCRRLGHRSSNCPVFAAKRPLQAKGNSQ
jgi:hypothetical protein